MKFTFGLTREESAKYIGPQSGAMPAGTPPAAGAAPPSASRRGGSGTGFYINRQGHVLTNAHVVDKCKSITVARPGSPAIEATILKADAQNDLAVLATGGGAPAVASFRVGRPVRQGETVIAYGFPLSGTLATGGVLTSGAVNALAGPRDDSRYIQVSAPLQPGNSGGPLLDSSGAIVGVVTASLRLRAGGGAVPQNVNFALKVDLVRTFMEVAGVPIETTGGGRDLSLPDVGERARAFTVFVLCQN